MVYYSDKVLFFFLLSRYTGYRSKVKVLDKALCFREKKILASSF